MLPGLKRANSKYPFFGLSTKSLETLGGVASVRSSVRTSVRLCVTLFLRNRALLFSETLQLVRACKREKNVPSSFFYNFRRFGQKRAKMGHLARCVEESL